MVFCYALLDVTSKNRENVNRAYQKWRHLTNNALRDKVKFGDNPEVFYYQIIDVQDDPLYGIRSVFFEGVKIDVIFVPKDSA